MDRKPNPVRNVRAALAFVRWVRRWRRRDWIFYNLGLAVAVTIGYLHVTSPPPAVSVESYDRIELGMTAAEVHRIVRARPGGYGYFWAPGESLSAGDGPVEHHDEWGCGYGVLEVGYDASGRVSRKGLDYLPRETAPHPETWPWWRRLYDRSVPAAKTPRIYSPF
jgi:hypothetical protein